MENAILDQIHKHASIRRYKPDPVPVPMIEAIVKAGQRASTASNLQTYCVVAVTDPEKRKALAELSENQQFIAEAPVFLTWCADMARLERVCQLQKTDLVADYVDNFLTSVVDATLASQNAALAAESFGLGMCYIAAMRNDIRRVIDLLHLPHLVFPIFGMTLGWPEMKSWIKPRLPLKAILHWEEYDPHQDASLNEYDQTIAATGIYKGRQTPFPGRETEMENYGWMEHSARRAARPARKEIRLILEEQGFTLK